MSDALHVIIRELRENRKSTMCACPAMAARFRAVFCRKKRWVENQKLNRKLTLYE
jgi:hypothetical protein